MTGIVFNRILPLHTGGSDSGVQPRTKSSGLTCSWFLLKSSQYSLAATILYLWCLPLELRFDFTQWRWYGFEELNHWKTQSRTPAHVTWWILWGWPIDDSVINLKLIKLFRVGAIRTLKISLKVKSTLMIPFSKKYTVDITLIFWHLVTLLLIFCETLKIN